MNVRPARLAMNEQPEKLDAEVRPADRLDLISGLFGIALAVAALMLSRRLAPPGWPAHLVQIAAALAIAFMLRRLVYYAGTFVSLHAGRSGLTVEYPCAGMKKILPAKSLTPVRLTDEEGSPLAGINMGPLGGSLWCEADGRYVCFGRGLSEKDARVLAERINAKIGKSGTGNSRE